MADNDFQRARPLNPFNAVQHPEEIFRYDREYV